VTEAIRLIEGGQLRLDMRGYGETTFDIGSSYPGFSLGFPNPNAITAIQVSATVTQATATSCSSNPTAFSGAQLVIGGFFFNTGTPTPGSLLNDVFADAFFVHNANDSPNVVHAQYVMFQCLDDFCGNSAQLGFGDLGTAVTGQPVTLSIQWDQPNHQFVFQRDGDPPAVASYSVSDTSTPGSPSKGLQLGHGVPNCTTTPRPSAFMSVLVGSVFVNQ